MEDNSEDRRGGNKIEEGKKVENLPPIYKNLPEIVKVKLNIYLPNLYLEFVHFVDQEYIFSLKIFHKSLRKKFRKLLKVTC